MDKPTRQPVAARSVDPVPSPDPSPAERSNGLHRAREGTIKKPVAQFAAMRRSAGKEHDAPLGVPTEPLAADPREGLRRGIEQAALYTENLTLGAVETAFGADTPSRHTRTQAMQILWGMIQKMPDNVPVLPKFEGED